MASEREMLRWADWRDAQAAYEPKIAALTAEIEQLRAQLDDAFAAITNYLTYPHVPESRNGLELIASEIGPPELRETIKVSTPERRCPECTGRNVIDCEDGYWRCDDCEHQWFELEKVSDHSCS